MRGETFARTIGYFVLMRNDGMQYICLQKSQASRRRILVLGKRASNKAKACVDADTIRRFWDWTIMLHDTAFVSAPKRWCSVRLSELQSKLELAHVAAEAISWHSV